MSGVTWNDYGLTTGYATVLPGLQDRLKNLLKQDFSSDTNIPSGAQCINTTTGRRQTWNGSAWSDAFLDNIRQANNNALKWRNAANNADVSVVVLDASDKAYGYFDYIMGRDAIFVGPNTADNSDTRYACLSGGGAYDYVTAGRGANIIAYGNDHATTSQQGNLFLQAGNAGGGKILLYTAGSLRWTVSKANGSLLPVDVTSDIGAAANRVSAIYSRSIFDCENIYNSRTNENLKFQTASAGTGILFQPAGTVALIIGANQLVPWARDNDFDIGQPGGRFRYGYIVEVVATTVGATTINASTVQGLSLLNPSSTGVSKHSGSGSVSNASVVFKHERVGNIALIQAQITYTITGFVDALLLQTLVMSHYNLGYGQIYPVYIDGELGKIECDDNSNAAKLWKAGGFATGTKTIAVTFVAMIN